MAAFTYEVTERIGCLSEESKSWRKQLNMVRWGEHDPKLDIREWMNDDKFGKGLTFTPDELAKTVEILSGCKGALEGEEQGEPIGDPKYNCRLYKECGVVAAKGKNWNVEVNVISWGTHPKCFDVRQWNADKTSVGKGITLTQLEADNLIDIYNEKLK